MDRQTETRASGAARALGRVARRAAWNNFAWASIRDIQCGWPPPRRHRGAALIKGFAQ
jgi:hypothetical protein